MQGLEWSWLQVTMVPSLLAFVYIWRRLIVPLHLPRWAYISVTALHTLLAASAPAVLWAQYLGLARTPRLQLFALVCWSGVLLTMCVCTVLLDVFRFVLQRISPAHIDNDRRVFLQRALSGAAVIAGPIVCAEAFREGLQGPEITAIDIALKRLPKTMDGFCIVQLSDLHIAQSMRLTYVEDVVKKTLALKPDLIVITGDLADGGSRRLHDLAAPLADLRAPHGIYSVTGNHEYYCDVDAWLTHLATLGIHTLRNERVTIGSPQASFDLAGIDDLSAHHVHPTHRADLDGALHGRDPDRELILLAHQPKAIFAAAGRGVGLMLSGHTHGGQIWPMGYVVHLVQPYVRGWAQHGNTQIYVNRGTGYGGPPMRLAVPAEITHITLRAEFA